MATAVQVDREQSNAVNLAVLKRQDSKIQEIVDTATHVVIYEFDEETQSWKRKDVEGCLFVVNRSVAPFTQIFVNNRLSTTNMTLPVTESLVVDSVDTFLILRCPDASYASGYAIYGVWFYPEEDREKILNLLNGLIQTQKEQPQTTPAVQPNGNAKSSKQKPPKPQPSQQQQQQQIVQAQPQQLQQQPAQAQQPQQKPRSRSRSRNNKREDGTSSRRQSGSNASAPNAAAPTMILQRSPKGKTPPPGLAQDANGTVPMSKADGIAAGEAILGMISQPQAEQQPAPQQDKKQRKQQQTAELLVPTAIQPQTSNAISKEQLKQTLISLLDDTQFFDQIYHAYVDRVLKRAA